MASLSSSYLFDPPSVKAINQSLVNSNAFDPAPSLFSSNVNPASINPRALPEQPNSVQVIKSFIPGLKMSGGSKRKRSRIHKKRINNISSMYKMKGSRKTIRRRIRQIKSRLRRRIGMKSRKNHKRSNRNTSKGMIGGYSQHLNNVPHTPNMSTGGPLPVSLSALANPVPYQRIFNSDGLDNLNHFRLNSFGNSGSGMGFLSRGSY
jgi:hypothetical protein